MNRELLESLVKLSASLQEATKTAKAVDRKDLIPGLRSMGWTVAEMIAACARDQSADPVKTERAS